MFVLKSDSSGHPKGVVDLGEGAGEDHVGGDAAHHGEVCGYSGETSENEFVGGVFVIGDDEDILAGDEFLFRYLSGKAHKAVVKLGVQDYESIPGCDVVRDGGQKLHFEVVFTCETLDSLAYYIAIKGRGKRDYPHALGPERAVYALV